MLYELSGIIQKGERKVKTMGLSEVNSLISNPPYFRTRTRQTGLVPKLLEDFELLINLKDLNQNVIGSLATYRTLFWFVEFPFSFGKPKDE